ADVLRRGFDNAIANWPLLLFRFAESMLAVVLIFASIAAIVVPVLVSAGISNYDPSNAEGVAEAVVGFVVAHLVIIAYVIGVFLVLGALLIALHSFVVGGVASVLVDAERLAPPGAPRDRFRRSTFERRVEGGRNTW